MKRPNYIKTAEEVEIIAEGGKLLSGVLGVVKQMAAPGVTTKQLSDKADELIVAAGGVPSFKGYGPKRNPFPAALCVSVNDEVVHGIPSNARALYEGDIVGLDIGMIYKGLYTDMAVTVGVGKISKEVQRLIDATRESLMRAIKAAEIGNRIGDIGFAAQGYAEANGFSVVRDLVGHGVGYAVHEAPEVPNYGRPGTGMKLEENLVIAIEPMLCEGEYDVVFDDDGWTIRTMDGKLSAHFEHTIAVTKNGPRILTA